MSFSQALSGLNGASTNLKVIGNNIANSQTVGFKSSTTQFADVYADAKAGLGTKVAGVLQNHGTGNLETTGRSLDLAITGGGFFQFSQAGQTVYSRNGQLTMTPEGYLENAQGARLIGATGPLQIPADGMLASATTKVETAVTLDSRSNIIAAPFDPSNPDTYNLASTVNTYDSLGNMHTVTTYYVKTGVNQWEIHAGINGSASASPAQPLNFNSNGLMTGYAPSTFTFPMTNGADDITFTLDMTGTMQFGTDFSQNSLNQDGYSAGALVGISINKNGDIVGSYANEQNRVLGTVQLANFRNPEGLKPIGDNAWAETKNSGQPLIGEAGVGLFGAIEAGSLEASNVDMTRELVNMIVAQRSFQANAQTIKTQDEVLQQAVNLR